MSDFVKVARVSDLSPNQLKPVRVGEELVDLASVDGQVHAFRDMCTHALCTFSPGEVEGDTVYCPCHGSLFNFHTGEVLAGPAGGRLPIFQVRVESDDILVAL